MITLYPWIVSFCMIIIAASSVVFPILFLVQFHHYRKEQLQQHKQDKD